jgi:hypothetical protein
MADDKIKVIPLNAGILTGISLEELEDRLEMQMLGLLDAFALASVTTSNCPNVTIQPNQ